MVVRAEISSFCGNRVVVMWERSCWKEMHLGLARRAAEVVLVECMWSVKVEGPNLELEEGVPAGERIPVQSLERGSWELLRGVGDQGCHNVVHKAFAEAEASEKVVEVALGLNSSDPRNQTEVLC